MNKRFVKPDPAAVTAYALSIGFRQDGEQFCDYYQSRGWMVGKCPMKDWQAAVRNWKRLAADRMLFDPARDQARKAAQARERALHQEELHLADYAEQIRAIRSWIGRSDAPGCIGDPAQAERDLVVKAQDNFGRPFVARLLHRVNNCKPA